MATKDLQNKGLIIELQSYVTALLSQKSSGKTCFIIQPETSINFRLTNRLRCFQMTSIIEKDSSDNFAFLFILFKTTFKSMNHRNYKKFNPIAFLYNLGQQILKGEMYIIQMRICIPPSLHESVSIYSWLRCTNKNKESGGNKGSNIANFRQKETSWFIRK